MFSKKRQASAPRAVISGPVNVKINGTKASSNPLAQFSTAEAMMASSIGIHPTTTAESVSSASSTSATIESSQNSILSQQTQRTPQTENRSKDLRLQINSSFNPESSSHRQPNSPSVSSISSSGSTPASVTNAKVIDHVQAKYSFTSEKQVSLSFKAGDIIRVFLKLESGWWDGLNPQGQRGWFPSNYTEPLPLNLIPSDASTFSDTSDSNSNIGAHIQLHAVPLAAAATDVRGSTSSPQKSKDHQRVRSWSQVSDRARRAVLSQLESSATIDYDFNPATTDYKYYELTDLKDFSPSQWTVCDINSGKYFLNHSLKAYTSSLPQEFQHAINDFDSIGENSAKSYKVRAQPSPFIYFLTVLA